MFILKGEKSEIKNDVKEIKKSEIKKSEIRKNDSDNISIMKNHDNYYNEK
jgi:hypothetical protein